MINIAERLRYARKLRGLSQEKLAAKADCTQGAISQIENGLSEGSRYGDQIAEALSIRREWLIFGRGPMETIDNDAGLGKGLEVREPSREYEVFGEKFSYVSRVEGPHLSAGSGEVIWDFEEIDQSHAFRREWLQKKRLNPSRCKLYSVRGDSMSHSIQNGDLVMLNLADREPVSGEIFALITADGLKVKRLHRRGGSWWLTSDNPDRVRYPDEQLQDEHAAVIGRVVWRGGDL